jgi:uncharacterized protein (DUF2235 family)
MSKNIIICCDGTDNQFSGCQTNVVRLYKCAQYVTGQQVCYYDPGVGTMPSPGLYTDLAKRASVLLGLAVGLGFTQNVEAAYRFLMQTYEEGDRVYLFGFSRGAFTVRALAGMLHAVGLLRPNTDQLIPFARRYWRKSYTPEGALVAADFKQTLARVCKPYFIGVWDTVGAVGWIDNFKTFPYTQHNPDVEIFRHAVSLDERRCCFRQNLMRPDQYHPDQNIKNIWFAGVHSDVGGGYPESEAGLSKIAFEWLVKEARQAGLMLDERMVEIELGKIATHNGQRLTGPDPAGQLHRSLHGFWWVLEIFPHKKWDPVNKRMHWVWWPACPRAMPESPLVHRSVPERLKLVPDYRPVNLPAAYQVVS